MADFRYDRFDERLRITELRVRSVERVVTLALAANAIPIAIGSLFEMPDYSSNKLLWTFVMLGWFCLGLSIGFGVAFITRAPAWAQRRAGERWLDITYVLSTFLFGFGAIVFAIVSFMAVLLLVPAT